MNILTQKEFEDILTNIEQLFFIQIGANDGFTFDPIHEFIKKYNWAGILVEPDVLCFDYLRNSYKDNTNVIYEMSAIADRDGEAILYHADTTLHSTLNLEHAKNAFRTEDPKTKHVQCLTSTSLIKKHNVTKLNLLQIDVEGYDCVILNNFPYNIFTPEVIRFEHIHTPQHVLEDTINMLKTYNYSIFLSEDRCDVIAVLNK